MHRRWLRALGAGVVLVNTYHVSEGSCLLSCNKGDVVSQRSTHVLRVAMHSIGQDAYPDDKSLLQRTVFACEPCLRVKGSQPDGVDDINVSIPWPAFVC